MSDTYTFTSDNGTHVDVPEAWITGMSLDDVGLCLACGEERYGTEPDGIRARGVSRTRYTASKSY